MYSKFVKFCSVILTVALLINLLPMQVLGADFQALLTQPENVSSNIVHDDATPAQAANATIIGEVVDNRTEFSKEYQLSNGLYMTAVYPRAVHFENNGKWDEIDNTLKVVGSGTNAAYTNTAGSWDILFPQTLTGAKTVSVSKDGYTLSFGMAGELRFSNSPVIRSGEVANTTATLAADETYAVTAVRNSTAQIYHAENALPLENFAHADTISRKADARISYHNVYSNTNVVYDLLSNQLKESIVIASFSNTLRGYRYTLNTGALIPVLNDDNSIDLFDANKSNIIFTMPAPFMVDNAGEFCSDVGVTLTGSNGAYTLTYLLPVSWLAEADRSWPVVLDPVITKHSSQSNIEDRTVMELQVPSSTVGVLEVGWRQYRGNMRFFMKFNEIPALTSADVVVHAEIGLYKAQTSNTTVPVTVHNVLGNWSEDSITWSNKPEFDATIEDYYLSKTVGMHYWDVTDIVRGWYETGNNYGMMFKVVDQYENLTSNNFRQYYSPDYSAHPSDFALYPGLWVTFRNNNGIESYWDYTSSSAGRAGTGYVNNYSGNLAWIRNDIGFGGNRMPVSISHVYNTNDSAKNTFGLGYGWRTNYNQTVGEWDKDRRYYYWEDGDGTTHYFLWSDADGAYKDEDGLELTLTVSGSEVTITDKNGNKSFFDAQGRLYKMENNQATKSNITITYDSTSKLISRITDGVGRKYNFTYTGDLLSKINYTGKGDTELSYVTFGYSGSNLTSITDKDGESSLYTYGANNLLLTAQDVDGYTLQYTYSVGSPKRVVRIDERDGTVSGGYLTFEYAHNQTTLTDHSNHIEILQFNDWGNLIAIQDDQGRAQYAQYARNKYTDTTSKANQMSLSSKMQNTVSNLLANNSFEQNSVWYSNSSVVTVSRSMDTAYLGSYSQKLVCSETGTWPYFGAFTNTIPLAPGATITVSAYIKTVDATVTVGIERQSDLAGFDSEIVPIGTDWSRYQVSITNNSNTADSIRCFLYFKSPGTAYIDCVQAELAATASRYNLLDNGNIQHGNYAWTKSPNMTSEDTYVITTPPIEELDSWTYRIIGSPTEEKFLSQTLNVSGSANDNYVLSGWAKADSVPLHTEGREFGLSLTFHNNDNTTTTEKVCFNADCHSTVNWQYAATAAVAEKDYYAITVTVAYSKNANTAYFDGIQLFKETFGTSYTYDDNGNVRSVVDLQNEVTEYEYDVKGDLRIIVQNNKAKMRYEYDDWHNVEQAITQKQDASGNIVDGTVYEFTYDTYGNNTMVKVVNGNTYISTSATYTEDGNHLNTTKDDLANETIYCYNEDTSVLEWVQYPNDTWDTRTTYTYYDMYRLKIASQAVPGLSEGTALTASYTYEDDQLKTIQTPTTSYEFYYGGFGLRTGVRVGNRWLALYEYSDNYTHHIEAIEYGEEHVQVFNYDTQDRVIEEGFIDGRTVNYTYDNTGNLSTMTDSATGRTTTYYYDLIDRLGKYKEVGPNYEHSVAYTYDERNNLSKQVETINGETYTTEYTYDYENRLVETNYGNISETVNYDDFGRLNYTTINKDGEYVVSSWTQYASGKTRNTTTSRLQMFGSSSPMDHMLYTTYQYDGNGNITCAIGMADYVDDPDGYFRTITRVGASFYHYDTANQLTRENNYWLNKTFVWTYDNAGNITSRTEYPLIYPDDPVSGTPTATYTYTYGDSTWGDLLTAYNGAPRTYDGMGNLLTDGTWTYTWQNGRELASMTDGTTTWNYTYDANGMRTQRSNGTTTYNYVYNGNQLTQMTVGNDTLYFTYGILGPTTVTWNGETYYYALNGQGDVIGIYDEDGSLVVVYNWDNAWGYNPIPEGSLASTLGTLNPLRYRSYVYDNETGYYYLQSRYYDPEIGRFINADVFTTTGQGFIGNNMFAYCLNNPVMYADPTGELALTTITIIAIIAAGGIVGGMLGAFNAAATGGNVVESAVEGCLTGMIGSACGLLIGNPAIAVGIAFGAATMLDAGVQATSQFIAKRDFSQIQIDEKRMLKTGFQTAMGTAVPQLGNAIGNAVDAFGTGLVWAEASSLITCTDVVYTNITNTRTTPQANIPVSGGGVNGRIGVNSILSCIYLY